jgi:hypothetical protein
VRKPKLQPVFQLYSLPMFSISRSIGYASSAIFSFEFER